MHPLQYNYEIASTSCYKQKMFYVNLNSQNYNKNNKNICYSMFKHYRKEKLKKKQFSLFLNPELDASLLKWMIIYSVSDYLAIVMKLYPSL